MVIPTKLIHDYPKGMMFTYKKIVFEGKDKIVIVIGNRPYFQFVNVKDGTYEFFGKHMKVESNE